ncbi:MAG: hypothetical protein ACFE0J_02345 [Elainellaceae cyanobacterium]
MKTDLRRIETALNQLNRHDRGKPIPSRTIPLKQLASDSSICSFKIQPSNQESLVRSSAIHSADAQPAMRAPLGELPNQPVSPSSALAKSTHQTHPELALGLLKELESLVVTWQAKLRQLQAQIQALYQEGPIVDGWLEAHRTQSTTQLAIASPASPVFPHQPPTAFLPVSESDSANRMGYRLCNYDVNGQLCSRVCPPDQLPQISRAIARYQKLKQLIHQRQHIENRLSSLIKSLIEAHPHQIER